MVTACEAVEFPQIPFVTVTVKFSVPAVVGVTEIDCWFCCPPGTAAPVHVYEEAELAVSAKTTPLHTDVGPLIVTVGGTVVNVLV